MRPEGPVVPFDESKDQRNVRPFRPQILFLHRFPGPKGPGWANFWPTWAAGLQPPEFLKNTPRRMLLHRHRRDINQAPSRSCVKIAVCNWAPDVQRLYDWQVIKKKDEKSRSSVVPFGRIGRRREPRAKQKCDSSISARLEDSCASHPALNLKSGLSCWPGRSV